MTINKTIIQLLLIFINKQTEITLALIFFKLQMYSNYQQSDRSMLNMFSVHQLFLEVLDELEVILNKKNLRVRVNFNWEQSTIDTFIHAVKYYLNHQPEFFMKALEQHKVERYDFEDKIKKLFKESKDKTNSLRTAKESKAKQPLKKQDKNNDYDVYQEQEEENVKKEDGNEIKLSEAGMVAQERVKLEEKDEDNSDDIEDFLRHKQEGILGGVKIENGVEVVPVAEGQKKVQMKEQVNEQVVKSRVRREDSEDQSPPQMYPNYIERALPKSNCLIYGMFAPRNLKRRAKAQTLSIEMSNCFIKMLSNGRDCFFDRMHLQLGKIEKGQASI